jgi:hypothetical protein
MVAARERFDLFRVTIFVSASNGSSSTILHNPLKESTDWFRSFVFGMIIPIACYLYWSFATKSSPVLTGVYLGIPALLTLSVHFGIDAAWGTIPIIGLLYLAVLSDILAARHSA